MRPTERIDNFLTKVDWSKLSNRWKLEIPITRINRRTRTYWKQNSDQRFGQVLINLNLVPDNLNIWLDEEPDILLAQGVPAREVYYWTSVYDKDMNRLEVPVHKLIKDLDDSHLEAIKSFFEKQNKSVPELIIDEINYRYGKTLE